MFKLLSSEWISEAVTNFATGIKSTKRSVMYIGVVTMCIALAVVSFAAAFAIIWCSIKGKPIDITIPVIVGAITGPLVTTITIAYRKKENEPCKDNSGTVS